MKYLRIVKKESKKHLDFVINSRPLTKEEEEAISNHIRAYKAKHAQKPVKAKRIATKKKKVVA